MYLQENIFFVRNNTNVFNIQILSFDISKQNKKGTVRKISVAHKYVLKYANVKYTKK